MGSAIAFIHWDNYARGLTGHSLLSGETITFNSRQERLHKLNRGDWLWLVARCPEDQQHYFVAILVVEELRRNASDSPSGQAFGDFAITADRNRSRDLAKTFPAEGLLRAFIFETGRPIKFGANIGQSLQTIRVLAPDDERVLQTALERLDRNSAILPETPFGLWTKCDLVFAKYFLKNWHVRGQPVAFLLYDSPPVLPPGAPVFIHSDKSVRILAAFRKSLFVSGYKPTVEEAERLAERERVWQAFRAETVDPPSKLDFDTFWDGQHGVRSLFIMDNLIDLPRPVPFGEYGRALEWGYPMGVGYRYLTLSQSVMMLRATELSTSLLEPFLSSLLS
ncbi:MAG: hypothetical protein NTW68_00980 [candidate division NC10 bacterium]|nr:hypothetical protein [candidate division NC10 bacterium]